MFLNVLKPPGGFRTLRNNFYRPDPDDPTKLILKPGRESFDSVVGSKNAAAKLNELKRVLPEESYTQLQNAYFNRIIEGGTKNGSLDPKQFLRSVERFGKDPQLWDNVLTQESKDVIADLITDAIVLGKAEAFKTPKAAESAIKSALKATGGGMVRWAIWHKFGVIPAAAFSLARRVVQKKVVETEARQAVNFFKGVDSPRFFQGLKGGLKASVIEPIPQRFKALQDIRTFPFAPETRAVTREAVELGLPVEEIPEEELSPRAPTAP